MKFFENVVENEVLFTVTSLFSFPPKILASVTDFKDSNKGLSPRYN